jgi:hypothetical protein
MGGHSTQPARSLPGREASLRTLARSAQREGAPKEAPSLHFGALVLLPCDGRVARRMG